jgi:hypothetical protein
MFIFDLSHEHVVALFCDFYLWCLSVCSSSRYAVAYMHILFVHATSPSTLLMNAYSLLS